MSFLIKEKMYPDNNITEDYFNRIETITKNQTEIIRLKIYYKTADLATYLTLRLILFSILSLFIVFLNIGLSLFLGEMLGKAYWGFSILAVFYLICGLIFRKTIFKTLEIKISNILLSTFLKDEIK